MPNNIANQTLPGSYRVIEIDGELVPMQKVDGQWVTTAERLKTEAFMARFADTTTVPADAATPGSALTVNPDALAASYRRTSAHLEAYLIEILGDPQLILAKDPTAMARLKHALSHPDIARQVRGLIRVFNSPVWNRVLTNADVG